MSGWAAAILVAVGVGYGATTFLWPAPVADVPVDPGAQVQPAKREPIADADLPIGAQSARRRTLALYEHADDLDFAKSLNHPDLFGEEPGEAP